jgi:20S proteasome alpha/beta subunit
MARYPPQEPIVIAAADRMITRGQREYQLDNQTKMFPLTSHVLALLSGFGDPLYEVCWRSEVTLREKGITLVHEAANVVADEFLKYRNAQNQRRVLGPWDLDFDGFLKGQQDMDVAFIQRREDEMYGRDYDLGHILVAGVDENGGHVYQVSDPGSAETRGLTGFGVIGSGAEFAESSFMGVGYTRYFNWVPALALVHSSKRRAEVASGVGRGTDIWWITRLGGRFYVAPLDPLMVSLDGIHENRMKKEARALLEDRKKLDKILEKMNEAPKTQADEGGSENSPDER